MRRGRDGWERGGGGGRIEGEKQRVGAEVGREGVTLGR